MGPHPELMTEITVTVIGGGIVGCAIAAECAARGHETVLLEQESGLARGTTSRNSEVSHGGMYYPTGSLKAQFCVQGRRLLREFCREAGVSYQECGKLIVAVRKDEIPELERLHTLGTANDVEELKYVDGTALTALCPEITAVAALHSPRTGILDAEGAARALAKKAISFGAQIFTGAKVTSLNRNADHWEVGVSGTQGQGGRPMEDWTHNSRVVINAAGIYADTVAAMAGVDIAERQWQQFLSKGNYFSIDPVHRGRIKHLVYPVPPADGSSLGIHVCLDLAGGLRLGPDVEKMPPQTIDYSVDESRGQTFYSEAKRFLPWLKESELTPDMCGLRPKLAATGFHDFVIHPEAGPLQGLVNLVGIDSPGLTSAPAIAQHTAGIVDLILQ